MLVPQAIVDLFSKVKVKVLEGHRMGFTSGGMSTAPLSETINNYELWTVKLRNESGAETSVSVTVPNKAGLPLQVDGIDPKVDANWLISVFPPKR